MTYHTTVRSSLKRRCVSWNLIVLQVLLPTLASWPARAEPPVAGATSTMQTTPDNNADALKGMAISAGVSAAASSVGAWLSQFGTAEVKLNVDDDGHWDHSAFDFLAPLYDNKKSVLFTQLGLRAPDGRTTGSIGMGVRTFNTPNWMFGGNVFFDNDFTGQNRRVGLGAEAWTDYLKLAANTYIGTTNWHSSRDFDDYEEKPASGYDVRAEGYLPAYPQLGAKLMYEQYYGNDVALFDKDHLQSNPSAVTVGLNYTPISLITAGVDYKRGQQNMDETEFSVNLHYVLGQSWQSQISSDEVALRRSLAGSRYDLVDRNNEIVLQYRKKESAETLADMTLSSVKDNSPADGTTQNTVTLHAVTSSGKPVPNTAIIWSTTGNATLSSTTGVTDSNGNATVNIRNTVAEQITVSAVSGSLTRTVPSSFTPYVASLNLQVTKNNAQADGSDRDSGQVTLKDASGKIMPGVALQWQADAGSSIVSSDKVTDANGQATVQLTSTTAGSVSLNASALGKTESTSATFVAASVAKVAVSVPTNNVLADGSSVDIAQALVTDASGKAMSGLAVSWTLGTASAKATSSLSTTTNGSGIATLNLADTVAEGVTVTASAGGQSGNATATFTSVKAANVSLTSTGKGNASDKGITTALVTDTNGNPVSGARVTWSTLATAFMTCNSGESVTDAQGEATQTCYAVSGSAFGVTTTVTVNPQDTVNPSVPLTASNTRNYQF